MSAAIAPAGNRKTALTLRKDSAAPLLEMCSVRVGQTLFGIAIAHIVEIVGGARPQLVPLAPEFVGGLVHYRGDVLTTVSLRHLLGMPPREGPQDILVLEGEGGCLACWWIPSARCLLFPKPIMSPILRFSTNAAAPFSPGRTSSRTACW